MSKPLTAIVNALIPRAIRDLRDDREARSEAHARDMEAARALQRTLERRVRVIDERVDTLQTAQREADAVRSASHLRLAHPA